MEKFSIKQGINGWFTIPADPNHHPLLSRLHEDGEDRGEEGKDWKVTDPCQWESLEQGLVLIRETAERNGMSVQFCGNLKRAPVAILRELPKPEKPLRIFEGLHGMDGAKWGVSDFYEEYETALRDAIGSGAPFDTGWYGVKKEI